MPDTMSNRLDGLRVFVVEDEWLVATMIEDTLQDLGCAVVATIAHLEEAIEKASSLDFDAALLDLNLNGRRTIPVAEIIAERNIPFAFCTGYGVAGLEEEFRAAPVLQKPFRSEDLERVLAGLSRAQR